MYRRLSMILGVGLMVLWALGLGDPRAARWLVWMVGALAIGSFANSIFTPAFPTKSERIFGPAVLGTCLLGLWVSALVSGQPVWLTWWCFAISGLYFFQVISDHTQSMAQAREEGKTAGRLILKTVGTRTPTGTPPVPESLPSSEPSEDLDAPKKVG